MLPKRGVIIDPVAIHEPEPAARSGLAEGRARSLGLGDVASGEATASGPKDGAGGMTAGRHRMPDPAASAPPTSITAAAAASRVMLRPRPNRRRVGAGAAIVRRLSISSRRLDGAA